ncbi:MAG: hypothetical protein QOE97_1449 [Pseudonocardiales bacterium]|nr:hypothetical protein [Pseudonocardiales bacterium]
MTDGGSDVHAIQADIERTRAELADTVDALAAKLDVKAQAKQRAHELAVQAGDRVEKAKAVAPEPVQQALDKVTEVSRPVVAKAAEDKRRTAVIVAGALVALLVLRRVRRRALDTVARHDE